MNKNNSILLNKLKPFANNITEKSINDIINLNNTLLVKQNKCKLCNKNYNSDNKYYGSSCIKNLYHNSNIPYSKDIDNKELFLHSAIILKLGKNNLPDKKIEYIIENYLTLLYFEKVKLINSKIIKNEISKSIELNKKPIMKLNTAYRVTNILKRNKELFNNNIDIFVDSTILKSLKRYFTLSKMKTNYEPYYYIQLIAWELVVISGLIAYDYKLSAKCLNHSLSVIGEQPKDIVITNKDKDIINIIKKDDGFKEKIKKIIIKYSNNNTIDNVSSYTFTKGDLLYSLHNVTVKLLGKKINDKWTLNITITDTYDFSEILSNNIFTKGGKEYINKGNILNDRAAISSQYGVIKPYNITIKFDWSDFDA